MDRLIFVRIKYSANQKKCNQIMEGEGRDEGNINTDHWEVGECSNIPLTTGSKMSNSWV